MSNPANKSVTVSLRMTPEERRRLEQAAEREQLSVSEWVRRRIPPDLQPSKLKATV
jgi:predicted HicB family RNase H-like nuclease